MKNLCTVGVFMFFMSVLLIGIGTRDAEAGAICFNMECDGINTINCWDQPGGVCDGDEGTPGDDIICGSEYADIINGGGGDDNLCGFGGEDVISGGKGNDCLSGGEDNDIISGGMGNELIIGDAGNDELDGGKGRESIHGGTGNDDIYGGDGSESGPFIEVNNTSGTICGGIAGLFGEAGYDYIEGGKGEDNIDGGTDDDECHGGPQNDIFSSCECGDVGPLPPSPQGIGEADEQWTGECDPI